MKRFFSNNKTKICVPLTAASLDELIVQAAYASENSADLVEWRADMFSAPSYDDYTEVLVELRKVLNNIPIIFTWRTHNEGGHFITSADYEELLSLIISSKSADIVDVELFMGDETVNKVIELAHSKGVEVITSFHDFEKTPSSEEIGEILNRMNHAGADCLKIAVMPNNSKDVLRAIDITLEFKSENPNISLVIISMGELGKPTRILGNLLHSAMTFATAGASSAPGQLDILTVRKFLSNIEDRSNTMEFKIRDFLPEDRDFFISSAIDFYSTGAVVGAGVDEGYFERTFNVCLEGSPFVHGMVFMVDEKKAGYALLSFTYSNEVGGLVVLIEEVYILSEFQSNGIGSRWFELIEEQYVTVGKAKRLRLEVAPDNTSAKMLYEKIGYEPIEYIQMKKDFI